MALQQAFGFLQPILYDADFIPNPLANSTALDAAAEDHAFSNILNDASRALFNDATYTLPPSPIPFAPEVSNEEEPTDSGVVLSSLKFYTGRRRDQSCIYNGFLYSHNRSKSDWHSYWECKSRKSYSSACKGRLTTLRSTFNSNQGEPALPPSFHHFIDDIIKGCLFHWKVFA